MQTKKTVIVTMRMTPKVKKQLRQRAKDANMGRITVPRSDEFIDKYTGPCQQLAQAQRESATLDVVHSEDYTGKRPGLNTSNPTWMPPAPETSCPCSTWSWSAD